MGRDDKLDEILALARETNQRQGEVVIPRLEALNGRVAKNEKNIRNIVIWIIATVAAGGGGAYAAKDLILTFIKGG